MDARADENSSGQEAVVYVVGASHEPSSPSSPVAPVCAVCRETLEFPEFSAVACGTPRFQRGSRESRHPTLFLLLRLRFPPHSPVAQFQRSRVILHSPQLLTHRSPLCDKGRDVFVGRRGHGDRQPIDRCLNHGLFEAGANGCANGRDIASLSGAKAVQ
jgi:hypothetical protein